MDRVPWLFASNVVVSVAWLASLYYGTGTLADIASTRKALEMGATELNPRFPAHPSAETQLSKYELARDCVAMAIGMVLPPVGVTVGMDRWGLANRNTKKAKEFRE